VARRPSLRGLGAAAAVADAELFSAGDPRANCEALLSALARAKSAVTRGAVEEELPGLASAWGGPDAEALLRVFPETEVAVGARRVFWSAAARDVLERLLAIAERGRLDAAARVIQTHYRARLAWRRAAADSASVTGDESDAELASLGATPGRARQNSDPGAARAGSPASFASGSARAASPALFVSAALSPSPRPGASRSGTPPVDPSPAPVSIADESDEHYLDRLLSGAGVTRLSAVESREAVRTKYASLLQMEGSYPLSQSPQLRSEKDYLGSVLWRRKELRALRFVHQRSPIPRSLLRLGEGCARRAEREALEAGALEVHSNIRCFTKDVLHSFPATCGSAVVQAGLLEPRLRDEILCQLVKHTSQNPGAESELLGWRLLYLCLLAFPPEQCHSVLLAHIAARVPRQMPVPLSPRPLHTVADIAVNCFDVLLGYAAEDRLRKRGEQLQQQQQQHAPGPLRREASGSSIGDPAPGRSLSEGAVGPGLASPASSPERSAHPVGESPAPSAALPPRPPPVSESARAALRRSGSLSQLKHALEQPTQPDPAPLVPPPPPPARPPHRRQSSVRLCAVAQCGSPRVPGAAYCAAHANAVADAGAIAELARAMGDGRRGTGGAAPES
jgi:hypothetical protein